MSSPRDSSSDAPSNPSPGPSTTSAGDPPTEQHSNVDERIDAARDRLRGQRRILSDERTALRIVSDRLLDVDAPLSTATVESHYRETVMAVPHYQTEYGDTLPQSLAA